MTGAISIPMEVALFPAAERTDAEHTELAGKIQQAELAELVRGNEQGLLARLTPLVCREDVALDLGSVERIDAAGIAALIALYVRAGKAGHRFALVNLTPRAAGILALVGLARILSPQNAGTKSRSGLRFLDPAA